MPDCRPLTPFEHLLFRDTRPGFPMCFYLHCEVEGALDPDRLAAALRAAAVRHPLLRSRVRDSWWRPAWREPDREPEFFLIAPATGGAPPPEGNPLRRAIDVRRSSGIRMVAIPTGPDRWSVVLQVQHTVCDGLAGLEYLGDVWSTYHGGDPAPFRTPSRVVRRLAPAAGPAVADSAPPSPGGLSGEAARFAGFVPSVLARGPADGGCAGDVLPYSPRWFDREETASIKSRAAAAGVAINDLIVAAVMRVAVAWNRAAGRPARNVRITMPASLEPPGTRGPAGNDMGYAFLDRDARDCDDTAALVRSLAAASRWIQEHRAARVFVDTLARIDRFPPAMRVLTRVPLPLSTAVVSYVGNVGPRMRIDAPRDGGADLPGGLRITLMAGVPPVRPGTRLAVGVVAYDGRLCLTTLCDERGLGRAAAALLPDAIRAEVLACAAELPASGESGSGDRDGRDGE